MTKDELQAGVDQLQWYHAVPLPHGIVTPGWAPFAPDLYRIPADLTGLRVLDIGAWDGYWSFEALRRGAAEVVAIDDFSNTIHEGERRSWAQFDFCRQALGYHLPRVSRDEMSVYDMPGRLSGNFDVVFFFGVIYHLRHPLLALEQIAKVMWPGGRLCVESAILDDFSPYNGGLGHGYPGSMLMEFYPGAEYGPSHTNWWVPSLSCLAWMISSCGFTDVNIWKIDKPEEIGTCRGYAQAKLA
jgi:tRNA (mo5U34)-methyltransferase